MKRIFFIAFSSSIIALSGCMTYQKPPAAINSGAYTKIADADKNTLPATMGKMTLKDAQKIALENNPDFRSIRFSIDAARARYYQTYSGYAPTLNATMSVSQSFSRMYSSSNTPQTDTQDESYRPGLSGQILIFDCLAREMNILDKKYQLKQAKSAFDDARRLLLRAVAYAYNDILLAEAQLEIARAEIEYSRQMLDEAQIKFDAGTVLMSDLLNFKTNLKNGELSVVKIENNIKAAKFVLAGYLGLSDGTIPEHISFPLPEQNRDNEILGVSTYIDQALANRPDLKKLREQLESAKYSYYGTLAAFGPTVSGNYSIDFTNSRSVNSSSANSRNSKSGLSYSITVSWNLFNGFSDYFASLAASALAAESDYLLAQGWINVVTDVRTAHENFISSVKEAALSQEICAIALETRDLVDNEYRAGTALVTRVNEAEMNLVQAQNNFAAAVINIRNAKAQLEAAVNADITLN